MRIYRKEYRYYTVPILLKYIIERYFLSGRYIGTNLYYVIFTFTLPTIVKIRAYLAWQPLATVLLLQLLATVAVTITRLVCG